MFGLKKHVQLQVLNYLNVIRPWAMGKDSRGWLQSDFETQGGVVPEEWFPIPEVKALRTHPSHVIFPITPYTITSLDRLVMTPQQIGVIQDLNQSILSFNTMVGAFAGAADLETRWCFAVMLHAGLIGTVGTNGLLDHFLKTVEAF